MFSVFDLGEYSFTKLLVHEGRFVALRHQPSFHLDSACPRTVASRGIPLEPMGLLDANLRTKAEIRGPSSCILEASCCNPPPRSHCLGRYHIKIRSFLLVSPCHSMPSISSGLSNTIPLISAHSRNASHSPPSSSPLLFSS